MTPPAVTTAGRKVATAGAAPRPVRAGAAPRAAIAGAAPRPVRAGATAPRPVRAPGATRSARATHAPRPTRSTPRRAPRRVSGPVNPRHPAPQQPLANRLALGAVQAVRTLPDHRLLDRLVRGRAWIPVLGLLLAGIVATQVEVLKLGASMGRWMERSAALTSHNQALQASVAALSDDQRIERAAAGMGMVMPAPTAISFVSRRPAGGVREAIARIHAPDPAQFLATLQADTALSTSVVPAATSTSASSGPGLAPAGTVISSGSSASGAAGTTSAGAPSAVTPPPGATSQSTGG